MVAFVSIHCDRLGENKLVKYFFGNWLLVLILV